MFRPYVIGILTLCNITMLAQTKRYNIVGRVTDTNENYIPFAAIQNIITKEGAVTNNLGRYAFSTTLPLIIKASRIGYKSVIRKVNNTGKNDTMEVDFVLQVDSAQLQSVQITATNEPELVKESAALEDFEVRNGKIWLLYAYPKEDRLEIYDSSMNYITSQPLRNRAHALTKTPHNILYIADKDSVWLFDYYPSNKSINNIAMAADAFFPNLKGLIAYSYPYYYYTNFENYGVYMAPYKFFFNLYSLSHSYPYSYYSWLGNYGSIITYYYYDKINGSKVILYHYDNESIALKNHEDLMQMSGVSNSFADSSGVSQMPGYFGQAPSGDIAERNQAILAQGQIEFNDFDELLVQLEWCHIFCPLRIIKKSIYIFNFDNDTIYLFAPNNRKIRTMELPFNVHGIKYQKRDILVNDKGTECYFKFEIRGTVYLQKIDLNTDKIIGSEKLAYPFPEKIRIMGGYVYYSCTRNGANQEGVLYLYRQKL